MFYNKNLENNGTCKVQFAHSECYRFFLFCNAIFKAGRLAEWPIAADYESVRP